MTRKIECNKCGYLFSAKGGNYNKHVLSCDGTYTPFIKSKCCNYCKIEFSDELSASQRANHTRWCEHNPKRKDYTHKLNHARAFINEESILKRSDSISKAHKDGRYEGSAKKSVKTKIKKGNLKHTDEAKEKIRQKALSSNHRRLRKGVVEYKGILLDSSWELALARRLDELDIKWIRPDPLKWIDKEGIIHNYFSDFYLLEYDIYIDPKNPYAIQVQKEKLDIILNQYKNILILDTLQKCKEFKI